MKHVTRFLITMGLAMGLAACQSSQQANGTATLMPCPATPNCVCSDDDSARHSIEPLQATESVASAWDALLKYLQQQTQVSFTSQRDDYVAVEFRTRWLRFVDDVEFQARPNEGTIAMRSASRLGISDLGTNRRRLEQLRAALAAEGVVHPHPGDR